MSDKLKALLFIGFFVGAFGFAALNWGILPLLDISSNGWSSRNWKATPATMLGVDEERRDVAVRGEQDRYRTVRTLHVRYRYEFGGRSYESSRIGLLRQSSDDIDGWQSAQHQALLTAVAQESQVTAWVDPGRPSRSVLDRTIRWSLFWSLVPVSLVLTAVALAMGWFLAFVLLARPEDPVDQSDQFTKSALYLRARRPYLRVMAAFWCVLIWPLAALSWVGPQPGLARVLVTLVAGVGGWLLVKAWRLEDPSATSD